MGGGATTSGQLLDCGNWSVSASWAVPADATSGIYIARPTRTDTGGASHIPFIVRDDAGSHDLVFQTSDTTWQSYNPYGGYNAYGSSGAVMAEKLSYNRPFTTRGAELENYLFNAEYPMIRWLERNGYDVAYMSAIDTERNPNWATRHKVFLSVGHDEYWSQGRRDAVTAARDAGVHLAFFSGNEIYWKTRWEDSTQGATGTNAYRTQVVYKEGSSAPSGSEEHRNCYNNDNCDPTDTWTGQWRESAYSGAVPENSLSGQISWRLNSGSITVPAEYAPLRFWRNTDVATLAPGGQVTLANGTLGYEWDPEYPQYADSYPAGRILLSTTNVTSFVGPEQHHLSLYRAPSGALVFGAGTVQWSWGLDGDHDPGTSTEDPNVQQATVNLFADMGVQPATLQDNLTAATASTDTTPPTVTVTSPASLSSVPGGAVTITGTATDVGGVVAGVEISTDGGTTWRRATGRDAWSHTYAAADGLADIRVRAVDDSARLSTPITHGFTVAPRDCSTTACTIWATAPFGVSTGNDGSQAIEAGTKFTTAEAGLITSVRVFKATEATWNLRGRLRLLDGTVLGESADTAVSGSGWMDLPLSTPVPVEPGTTYVASYFSASGAYSYTDGYFATASDNPPLRALAGGEAGPNGVYRYGPISSLPLDRTFQNSNYWADVTFVNELPAYSFFNNAPPTNVASLDASDPNALELGLRFRSTVNGFVEAVRFYKAAQATGTITVSVWSGGGDRLGGATYAAVADDGGWREVVLDTPVSVTAGTAYVASYHSPSKRFALSNPGFFASDLVVGPLTAPADADGARNAPYVYSETPAFPDQNGGARSYYVDILLREAPPADATAPTVVSTSPSNGAVGIGITSAVTVTFSESIDADTIPGNVTLAAGATPVAATVTYDAPARRATLTPASPLAYATTYTATVKGGAGGVADVAGNKLAADLTWTFTTRAETVTRPDPNVGPGGPVLVVKGTGAFGSYLSEILRAEGLNLFTVGGTGALDATGLAPYETVVLGETTLSSAQVTALTSWVNAGGNVVALRPDPQLADLLGLTSAGGTLAEGYIDVDTGSAPGAGIVGETMQFHGTADLYTANAGTQVVATLYSNATTATPNPAVTLRTVGTAGGSAASFTYDLARSIVLTRQGNPASQNINGDGSPGPFRGDDMFHNGTAPDWVNLDKVAIPQADEQQRLLANVLTETTRDALPLPRFWYLPRGEVAALVMTADEHNSGNVPTRFEAEKTASPAGCSVDDWECIRSTSYLYPDYPSMSATQASAYEDLGFEIALHPNTDCLSPTRSGFETLLTTQLAALATKYPNVEPSVTSRNHCIAWADYTTIPEELAKKGIHLDTNYYFWPPTWVNDRPGLFTGSGFPQRFATEGGDLVDVYQATTQMTDESGQSFPATAITLMDRAINQGFYGTFVLNLHTDGGNAGGYHDSVVTAAKARSVPVVTAKQLMTWTDGRNASSFANLVRSGNQLTFSIVAGAGTNGLEAMLPTQGAGGTLQTLTRGGNPVPFVTKTIKGVEYAVFSATAGAYTAAYDVDTTPPVISSVTAAPGAGGTATITWTTDEPATSRVDYGTSAGALNSFVVDAALTTSHSVLLTGLAPTTIYHYRVTSADAVPNTVTWPNPPAAPASFTTPSAVATDTTVADFGAGTTGANTYVSDTSGGEVILAPTVGAEFGGTTLPSGWTTNGGVAPWTGGTAVVSGGIVSVDGTMAGTTATFGPGRSLDFVATFSGQAFQHVGFVGDLAFNDPWAIVSTGSVGGEILARTNTNTTGISLGTGLVGSAHRYRIDWKETGFDFYVDGIYKATIGQATSGPALVGVSDLNAGGGVVSVDWIHMTPFASPGTFESRIHSAGSTGADWGALSYVADVPSGTTLDFDARTGETPTPDDGSWSSFAPITQGGNVATAGRYLQYRVTATSTTGAVTPTLESVTLPYTAALDTDPPGITGRSPSPGATDVPVATNLTVTFDEPMNPATITSTTVTLRAQGGEADVPATVSYTGLTATLDPTADLANGTVYTVNVAASVADASGNPLGGTGDTWNFTTVPAPTFDCPCTIFGTTPGGTQTADFGDYELGVKFRSDIAGYITGIRFYKHAGATGTHVGHLWSAGGDQLAEATFTSETASGWQRVDFATPVAVAANTTYIASYSWPGGYYAYQGGGFTSAGVTDPPLTALQHLLDGPNGVYSETPGQFPATGNGANYWVDVLFEQPDTTPPTISGRSPDAGATSVGTDTSVVVTFSEPVAPASVTSTSVQLRANGTGSDVTAALSVTGATVVLDPSGALAPYTSYTATVTTAVTDRFGNPLAATSTWSFTTGGLTQGFVDTTVGDFGLGTGANTYVSDTSGGELILTPTVGAEFDGSSLPSGWTAKEPPWSTDGAATVAGGSLSVDGTMAGTTATFGPGHSLEFVATFSAQPFQHIGYVADLAFKDPWAIVSTGNAGTGVLARTTSNPGGVSLGSGLLGSSHRYRIDWTASGFDFHVDGVLVTTIPFVPSGPMLIGASDANLGTALVADWIRMTPYVSPGTFESRVFDAGTSHDWTSLTASTPLPAATSAAFETRSGNTSVPDSSWSAWQAVTGDVIASPNARYAQYRAILATSDPARTPVVERVELTAQSLPANRPPVAVDDTVLATEDVALVLPISGAGSPAANDSDPDADPLTVTAVGTATGGTVALEAGSITFTPTPDLCGIGAASFPYTVSDDGALADEGVVTLNIGCTADAPVLDPVGDQTVAELVELAFTATASDADLDPLTFSLAGAPAGAAIDPETGAFAWTPSEAQGPGTYTFDVVVSDGTLTDSETISVTVTEVNLAPVLGAIGNKSVAEGATLDVALSATDDDVPAQGLTFSLAAGAPDWATLTGSTLTLAPGFADAGTYSLTVSVSDGSLSDSETFSVTVGGTNRPPVAVDDTVLATEDVALVLPISGAGSPAANDSDPDADPLTVTAVGTATGGTVALEAGSITFTPTPDLCGIGAASFPYTVSDDGALADEGVVTLNIGCTADAPVLDPVGDQTVAELVELAFTATASDADLDPLTFSLAGAPAGAAIDPETGAFAWTPSEAQGPGTYTFDVVVSDGTLTDSETISVTVTEVNLAPVLGAIGNKSVAEGATLDVALSATDDDVPAQGLTFSLAAGAPDWATLTGSTLTLAPGFADAGTYSLTVSVSDGSLSDSETFSVTVGGTNRPPVAVDDTVLATEDVALVLPISGAGSPAANDSDPDADPLTVTAVGTATGGTVALEAGSITFTPTPDLCGIGAASFPYTVSDDGALADEGVVTLNIGCTADAPVLDPVGDQTVAELVELAFTATASDADLDPLTFSLAGAPAGAAIDPETGAFAWTPSEAQGPGTYTFDVVVSDGTLTDSETISVTVTEVNLAPVLGAIGNKSVAEGATLDVALSATDDDVPAQGLTFSLAAGAPDWATLTGSTLTLAPGFADAGTYSLTVSVSDGSLSDSETFSVTVGGTNRPPVAVDDTVLATEDVALVLPISGAGSPAANDSDPDADPLTVTAVGTATGGTVALEAGSITFTPTPDLCGIGAASFPYTVSDDGALADEGVVTLNIGCTADAPVLDPVGDQTVAELVELAFTATASDADLDPLTFSLAGAPAGAAIDPETGAFAWTPSEAQGPGTYTFDVVVSDGTLTDSETISVTVTEVNLAPVLGAIGNKSVAEGATLDVALSATDDDVPAQGLTFSLAAGAPDWATLTGSTLTLAPGFADAGTYSLTVSVSDGSLSDSETFSVTVGGTNRPPVAVDDTVLATEDVALVLPISGAGSPAANDSDPDADPLTVTAVGTATGGTVALEAGSITFTPTPDLCGIGAASFPYTVSDDGALADEGVVTLNIGCTADAPVLDPVGDQTVAELVELAFTATASDADLDPLTFSLAGAPAGAAIDPETGAFAWTPSEAQGPGTYTFDVVVSDGTLTDSETISVTVTEVNLAPVLGAIGNKSVAEGATLDVALSATDDDVPAQGLTFSLAAGAPDWATLTGSTLTLAPGFADAGTYSLTVSVSDGSLSDSETFSVTVGGTNRAPVLGPIGPQTGFVGDSVELQVTATDVDGDTLTYSATGLPSGLEMSGISGLISGTLTTAGVFPVVVTVSDGALTDSEALTWTVTTVVTDDPPATPTGLMAKVTTVAVALDWSDNVEPDLAGYLVYRALSEDGPWTKLTSNAITTSTYADTTAPVGPDLYYRVTAVDAAGHESAPAEASAKRTVAFRSATFAQNGGNANTLVVGRPTGLDPDDVLLAVVTVRGSATITAPSGWTLVRTDNSGTTLRQSVYWRRAEGAPSSFTFRFSGRVPASGGVVAYEGVDTVGAPTPIDVHHGRATTSSTTSIVAPSVTTTLPGRSWSPPSAAPRTPRSHRRAA